MSRIAHTRFVAGLSAAVSVLAIASCSSTGDTASSPTAVAAAAGPPVETRPNNAQGYQPAFEYQTRAPAMLANAPVEVKEYVSSGIANPFSFEFLPSGNVIIAE